MGFVGGLFRHFGAGAELGSFPRTHGAGEEIALVAKVGGLDLIALIRQERREAQGEDVPFQHIIVVEHKTSGRLLVELGFNLRFGAIGQGLDQATVSARAAVDRATIGGVIDRLVDKRFVAREVSTKDRRARVLTLTDSGAAALAQVQAAIQSVQDTICQGGVLFARFCHHRRIYPLGAQHGNPNAVVLMTKGQSLGKSHRSMFCRAINR